ncbi:MAG: hypothetical protein K2Q45_03065 [Nitrosomonas sp.]|nr:hypothetical protein [Nitrosomonas sp.]
MINIDDLDLVSVCEKGAEITYKDDIKIKVLGPHAQQVRKADIIYFRKMQSLGKQEHTDEEFAQGAEDYEIVRAAARIGGWSGIKQKYTAELAEKLCKINPEIRAAVLKKHEELINFMKGK